MLLMSIYQTGKNRVKTELKQKNRVKPVRTGFCQKTEPNRNRSV
jgi:hypothetical protein